MSVILPDGWGLVDLCRGLKALESENKILTQKVRDKKGNKGELLFMQWLKDKNIPFIYLDQSQETYNYDYFDMDSYNEEGYYESNSGFKRVDYIIYFNGDLIGVDVKNLELQKSEKTDKYPAYSYYSIAKYKDCDRLRDFEEIFKIPVFYVFVSKRGGDWEWTSLNDVEKCYSNKYHCYQVSYTRTKIVSSYKDLSNFLIEFRGNVVKQS